MNLLQKLVEIRKGIDYFKKDTKGYKYEYVSGSQVLSKMKGKMDELGVILHPVISEDSKIEKIDNDWLYTSKMTYVWINAEDSEDRIETPWFLSGIQNDPSKAFGSALTYSERYFLLKFFGIPTDDIDPDANQSMKTAYTPKKEYSNNPPSDPGEYQFSKGKFAGKKISELMETADGMSYLQFLTTADKVPDTLKDIIKSAINKGEN